MAGGHSAEGLPETLKYAEAGRPRGAHLPVDRVFPRGLMRDMRIWGLAAIALWLSVFIVGAFVDSCPYRKSLAPHADLSRESCKDLLPPTTLPIVALPIASLTYPPVSVGLLVILASFVAGCAGRLTLSARDAARRAGTLELAAESPYLRESPFASSFRGFFAYLAMGAGLLAVTPEAFQTATTIAYVRLAGLMSAVGFVVGYDPSRLSWLLGVVLPRSDERPKSQAAQRDGAIGGPGAADGNGRVAPLAPNASLPSVPDSQHG